MVNGGKVLQGFEEILAASFLRFTWWCSFTGSQTPSRQLHPTQPLILQLSWPAQTQDEAEPIADIVSSKQSMEL